MAAWRAEFGDPKDLLTSFPKTDDDARAGQLSELARGLGVEFARPTPSNDGGTSEVARRNAEPFYSLSEYDNKALAESTGPIVPLPEVAASFHRAQKDRIENLVTFLELGTPPRWQMNSTLGPEAPVPNLQALVRLNRVLVTEALIRSQAADVSGARRALLAAWNLESSLRDRPEPISQQVAVSMGRRNAALVRRLDVTPDDWMKRLAQHDYRVSMMKAMATETAGEFESLPKGSSAFERASRADFLNLARKALVRLRDSGIAELPSAEERKGLENAPDALSGGAILAELVLPGRTGAWNRVDQLVLETEFTEKVLQLKKLRSEGGRWPAQVPGIESSKARAGRWIYEVDAKGRMSLAFSKDPEWVYQYGLLIPLRYESD